MPKILYPQYSNKSLLHSYYAHIITRLCNYKVREGYVTLFDTLELVPYKKDNNFYTAPGNVNNKWPITNLYDNEPFLVLNIYSLTPKQTPYAIPQAIKSNGRFNKFTPYVIPILEPTKLNIIPTITPLTHKQKTLHQDTTKTIADILRLDSQTYPPTYSTIFHILTKHGTPKWCVLEPLDVLPLQ